MKTKDSYDRKAVGIRLAERRKQYGWTRKFVANKIGIAEKYYADIERGYCGMSIETLIELTKLYGFTMDGLIYGEDNRKMEKNDVLLKNLETLSPGAQDYCLQMLLLFMKGITSEDSSGIRE